MRRIGGVGVVEFALMKNQPEAIFFFRGCCGVVDIICVNINVVRVLFEYDLKQLVFN